MNRPLETSGQHEAFRRLIEIISAIPEGTRAELFRLSLTDWTQAGVTTCHIVKAIREELEALIPESDLPLLASRASELDDTRSHIEVAFAVDRILRRSPGEEAD